MTLNPAFLFSQNWPVQILLIFAVISLRSFLVAGGSYLWAQRPARRHILKGEIIKEDLWPEIFRGLGNLMFDTVIAVFLIRSGIFKFTFTSSAARFAAVFAGLFVWSEIYFYYSHRLLHHPKLFWIHRHHHQALFINPWTSLSFSVFERFILLSGVVVLPALFSNLVSFPIEAYAGYFLLNYLLNVFGHFNVEVVPEAFVKSPFGKVLLTPTYHALHHSRYRGHYGLFTSVLDRLHGTYFTDYESAHARAYAGQNTK